MLKLRHTLGEKYSPLYFLAALGAGGLAVTFFMYLMFLTPHPDTPIPTFESWTSTFQNGSPLMQGMVGLAITGIILFSFLHLRVLFWNISEYRQFKKTTAYEKLTSTNAEVQLMAMPLTFAMSINVGFILGALFVPKLWTVVEYLFPLAIVAFAITGYFAMSIFMRFLSRVLVHGSFDCSRNNNLSQMLAIFAFTMVSVGFSASAAMSHTKLTSGIAMILSIMFLTVAILFAVTKLVLGFRGMFEHGVDREAAVSLWIMIPIITLVGITIFRLSMGMHHNFGTHIDPIKNLAMFSVFIGAQLLFGLLGYLVMKQLGYFKDYIGGEGKSIASYALICPGVAATVMAFFFIHLGLISSGLVEKYSIAHMVLLAPIVLLQVKTIMTMFTLNSKLLNREPSAPTITPAMSA
uniref:Uncharacterized protein n=1 Tax=uncultured Thiotrichaceae bacterium TaxID=298394 RepID=A0A6S6UCJ5_9GAMM|nr:MAG: Unknown protein [uncultured Thiotrichaceae bacterium]